jgi:hypothetical protein
MKATPETVNAWNTRRQTRTLTQRGSLDSPLDRAKRGQWDEARRFELKMLAARFLAGNKGGQLSVKKNQGTRAMSLPRLDGNFGPALSTHS